MKRILILALLLGSVAAWHSQNVTTTPRTEGDGENAISSPAEETPTCDWQVKMHPDATRFPINMDTHAAYAIYTYPNDGSIALNIEGDFPYSAFLSFTSYTAKGLLFDALLDKDIIPNPGVENPFQTGNPVNATSRAYRILVLPYGQKPPTDLNVKSLSMPPLPANSPGEMAVLVMRVYLPEGEDRFAGPLPRITAVSARNLDQSVPCPGSATDAERTPSETPAFGSFDSSGFPQPPDPKFGKILFYRAPAYEIPFADGSSQYTLDDCTGYLVATLNAEKVAVIHFKKIPIYFDNSHTDANTTMPETQVRYVSLGSFGASVIPPPGSDLLGNIAGPQMVRTADGGATFVLIPELLQQRTKDAIGKLARARHYNVMPMAGLRPIVKPFLIYRNKETATGFEGAVSKVPCYLGTPFDQAPVDYAASYCNMGPYAPQGVECRVGEFLSGRCGR